MYDVPIEESLEREMHYNSDFAQYMVDWKDRPSLSVGQYASPQDGDASRNHPVLGQTDYSGPPRLAFAYYYDDVEVVNPIGVARTKHKLALHYAQLLNAPPDVYNDLDTVFLVAVVLSTTQSTVGIAEVVQGATDEPVDGSSFGASMRRFHRQGGIQLRMGAGAVNRLQVCNPCYVRVRMSAYVRPSARTQQTRTHARTHTRTTHVACMHAHRPSKAICL